MVADGYEAQGGPPAVGLEGASSPSRTLPKRKKGRLSPIRKSPVDGDQDFIIYEDEASENRVELSPSVERFRKGRRPPRERSGSYWGQDILPGLKDLPKEMEDMEDMGEAKNGRLVLGDLPSLITHQKEFHRLQKPPRPALPCQTALT
ncbi:MAG: hypothetical protein LQ346_005098 [Caloplaca aetnensis]|nr:MAG: hypothetical protein LQ346_005098 [Caloplaca aetnensis]